MGRLKLHRVFPCRCRSFVVLGRESRLSPAEELIGFTRSSSLRHLFRSSGIGRFLGSLTSVVQHTFGWVVLKAQAQGQVGRRKVVRQRWEWGGGGGFPPPGRGAIEGVISRRTLHRSTGDYSILEDAEFN